MRELLDLDDRYRDSLSMPRWACVLARWAIPLRTPSLLTCVRSSFGYRNSLS